jgi:hypothetical protein
MRGQTTLDFAIGISIFLAVILFVFTFVPGLLEPFALSGESETVQANQIADRLAEGQLGDPAEPYVLDTYCTVAFFNGSYDADRCRYEGDDIRERLEISETTNVNITLERSATVGSATPDILCWNGTQNELRTADCSGSQITNLTTGQPLQDAGDSPTITARRVVTLAGEDATLKVVVW